MTSGNLSEDIAKLGWSQGWNEDSYVFNHFDPLTTSQQSIAVTTAAKLHSFSDHLGAVSESGCLSSSLLLSGGRWELE